MSETIRLETEDNSILILDQTKLPVCVEYTKLTSIEEVWTAIRTLMVRGAPAIGVCAAFGMYICAKQLEREEKAVFLKELQKAKEYLETSRPTAVNLFWALDEMMREAEVNAESSVTEIVNALYTRAMQIYNSDIAACKAIGEFGYELIKNCSGVLTHCNAGQLAAVKYGTALAPVYVAKEKGKDIKVFADETRPLLQGARLTAFELNSAGVDVTLICDNMAASVMKGGKVQAVLVGCDRVAANGDTANKVGTLGVAVLAKHFGIPFYVCAPTSTIDLMCAAGEDITIEERGRDEITQMWYESPMAPEHISVFNPAFDVTDASLITAFITECGIIYPPYDVNIKNTLKHL